MNATSVLAVMLTGYKLTVFCIFMDFLPNKKKYIGVNRFDAMLWQTLKMSMKLYENSAYKISSKQLTIVLKLQLRVTKFMLIVNNVQFKKWLSSSPSSYSHFLCGVDVRWHTPPCSTVRHTISRQSLVFDIILYFVQPPLLGLPLFLLPCTFITIALPPT